MRNGPARRTAAALALLVAGCLGARPAGADSITFPGSTWTQADPASVNVDPGTLNQAIALGRSRHGQGMITRWGKLVGSWGNIYTQYRLSSATKAWSSLITGLAIDDGLFGQNDRAQAVYPGFVPLPKPNPIATRWASQITIHELLTMTAGFGSNTDGFAPLKFAPGTTWFYSNSAVDALGDVVTYAYDRDLLGVLQERILRPIGVADSEVRWGLDAKRDTKINGKPNREFAGGVVTNPNTMARVGLLLMNQGNWNGQQLISADYVNRATHPQADLQQVRLDDDCAGQNRRYGLLWFTNADGKMPKVPRDAFFQWGSNDVFTLVVPSLGLVASRQGYAFGDGCYEVIEPIMTLMAQAMR
jgi:CubicO group peptidase (beta-lactamase class C family)